MKKERDFCTLVSGSQGQEILRQTKQDCRRPEHCGTYIEDSWIGQWKKDFLPILPNLLDSIEKYYHYGGGNHITGGIAQADVLGIFGKYGVYLATFWGDASNNYTEAGINLLTSVKCETSDIEVSSAYASIVGEDDSKLHIILLNKNYDQPTTFNFSIVTEEAPILLKELL